MGHTIVDGQTHPDDVNVSLQNLLGILNSLIKVSIIMFVCLSCFIMR